MMTINIYNDVGIIVDDDFVSANSDVRAVKDVVVVVDVDDTSNVIIPSSTLRELVFGQIEIGESQDSLAEGAESGVGLVELGLPLIRPDLQLLSVDEDGDGALEDALRSTFHAQQVPEDVKKRP